MYQRLGLPVGAAAGASLVVAVSLITLSLLSQLEPTPSTKVTTSRMIWSATRKKIDITAAITNTIAVVIMVSRREGQVTLLVSARTSCKNLNGDVRAMSLRRIPSEPT